MKGDYFKLCISLLVLGAFVFAADVLMPFVKRVPDLITFADEVIRPIALFIATGIAIYLGNLKLRKPKIRCTANASSILGSFYPPYVSSVLLENNNDINIFIYDVFVKFPSYDPVLIKDFTEPMILKALDSIKINLSPVSSYYKIPDDVVEDKIHEVRIMLGTNKGLVECKWRDYKKPTHIKPMRQSIGGKVYGENTRYIMEFKRLDMDDPEFALISRNGLIEDSFPFLHAIKWHENWKKQLEDICSDNDIEYCEIGRPHIHPVFVYHGKKQDCKN
ncbi:hypothetical protein [Pseudoalteromonas piscicida]|uniref:hypothetical protein n=1 Tax=Pseudoalteromonas piscicida TaxID=43662 RepID=UPI0027E4C5F3|nr:hypothetical protein [Pseudoalteromonas piscicida]WMO14848.1 hypothetical protein NI376_04300 [Pseudoalteromonas piscicida]